MQMQYGKSIGENLDSVFSSMSRCEMHRRGTVHSFRNMRLLSQFWTRVKTSTSIRNTHSFNIMQSKSSLLIISSLWKKAIKIYLMSCILYRHASGKNKEQLQISNKVLFISFIRTRTLWMLKCIGMTSYRTPSSNPNRDEEGIYIK